MLRWCNTVGNKADGMMTSVLYMMASLTSSRNEPYSHMMRRSTKLRRKRRNRRNDYKIDSFVVHCMQTTGTTYSQNMDHPRIGFNWCRLWCQHLYIACLNASTSSLSIYNDEWKLRVMVIDGHEITTKSHSWSVVAVHAWTFCQPKM